MIVDAHPVHHEIQSLFTFHLEREQNIPHIAKVDLNLDLETRDSSVNLSKVFALKEVVDAVRSFLDKAFAKVSFVKVTLEITNLCSDAIAIVGDGEHIEHLLETAIDCLGKTFKQATGVVSVIIHELKRPSDGAFLLKALFQEDEGISSRNKNRCLDMCKKYIAISLRKKLTIFGLVQEDALQKTKDESLAGYKNQEEVHYHDDAIIVKKDDTHVMIYLSRA
jgi:hypothetical protein